MRLESRMELAIVALVASLACMLPVFFYDAAGDLLHQYAMVECFGRELWTGHFYPRWCMNANAGYGSPVPIFYFPAPYYFAALFYPLRYAGLEIPTLYQIAVFATHTLTFLGMYQWLRTCVEKPFHAVIGAALFLLLSYRIELIYFRAAYSELFCMAIIPWLFVLIRSGRSDFSHMATLALLMTLGLLSHPSVMAIACGAAFLDLLVIARSSKNIASFFAACLLAACATAFHWGGMHEYAPYLGGEASSWLRDVWVNHFADQNHDPAILRLHTLHLATIIIGFALFAILRPRNKEVMFFAILTIAALFMSYSVSAPLWAFLAKIIQVPIPWRMFLYTSFFPVLMIAHGLATHRALTICAAFALIGLGLCAIPPEKPASAEAKELVIATKRIFAFARPRWVDARYDNDDAREFYKQFVFDRPPENAALAHGGEVQIREWNDHALILQIETQKPQPLFIEQLYFPLWNATINGFPAELKPRGDGTGRMMLEVPAGKSEIRITQEARVPYRALSLVSFLIMICGFCACAIKNRMRQCSN